MTEKKYEIREMTVGEIVAEGLEDRASRMPSSYREEAEILRREAEVLRTSGGKVIRIPVEIKS